MKDTRDDEIEIDLLQLFWVMKRRLWIMILAVVVGAAAASIAFLVLGVLAFPAAVSTGIMLLGIGLAGLGVSALLGWLVVWGIKALVSASIGAIKRSNEKRKARKLEQEKDAADWTYKEEV